MKKFINADNVISHQNFKCFTIKLKIGLTINLLYINMSNIYASEPPTSGKVILVTNYGNIDIELWTKEAPRACKNFIQLCMENYYENNVFLRIIKGFMIQAGDPTGRINSYHRNWKRWRINLGT